MVGAFGSLESFLTLSQTVEFAVTVPRFRALFELSRTVRTRLLVDERTLGSLSPRSEDEANIRMYDHGRYLSWTLSFAEAFDLTRN